MRRINSCLADSLLALAVFLIFNCAGYLVFSLIGPAIMSSVGGQTGALPPGSLANRPVTVVAFSTATDEPLRPTDSPTPQPPPLPLLPTVTAAPATTAPALSPSPTALPSPTPVTVAVTRRAPRPAAANPIQLEILSHKSYVDSMGWYHIVGEVQNNDGLPLEFVQVIAKLYDDTGQVIGTKLTFTSPDVIYPGGKAPFDIVTLRRSQWEKIEQYTLQVKGDAAEALLDEDLILLSQSGRIENDVLYVQGQVQNTGQTPALVKLIVTLYDADLNVTNTNWGYVDSGIIQADQTSSFEVKVDHLSDPNNFNYRIQIESAMLDKDTAADFFDETN